jgi:hypothetical protein
MQPEMLDWLSDISTDFLILPQYFMVLNLLELTGYLELARQQQIRRSTQRIRDL